MTNQDTVYLRNHVRHRLVPRIGAEEQGRLLGVITRQHELNHEIDQLLESFLDMYDANGRLDRRAFVQLPHAVAREVMAAWLRRHNIRDFDGKTIERLVHAAKIRESGKRTDVRRDMWMEIRADSLALTSPER